MNRSCRLPAHAVSSSNENQSVKGTDLLVDLTAPMRALSQRAEYRLEQTVPRRCPAPVICAGPGCARPYFVSKSSAVAHCAMSVAALIEVSRSSVLSITFRAPSIFFSNACSAADDTCLLS